MEIKMELVNIVNKAKENELREIKAKRYSRSCKRKEIFYCFLIAIVFIVVGLIGNLELNAEPSIKANPVTETTYPATGIVTAVGQDFIVFTDFNGNEWEISEDPEDLYCGDRVAVIMSDNGTPDTIYDDKIVSSRYCGWVY